MIDGWVVLLIGLPLIALFARYRRQTGAVRKRVALEAALSAYLMLVLIAVLFPLRVDPLLRADNAVWDYDLFLRNWVNLTPFASIRNLLENARPSDAIRQLAGNLVLLAPLGLLAPALFKRTRRVIPIFSLIAGTAIGIETIQYLARIARLSLRSVDVDDAILNFVGGAAGFLLWLVWTWGRKLREATGYEPTRWE